MFLVGVKGEAVQGRLVYDYGECFAVLKGIRRIFVHLPSQKDRCELPPRTGLKSLNAP